MSKHQLPAGRRQLGKGHIRFFRAAIEGVDLRRAWQYVELDEDDFSPALASATVIWIRETLITQCLSAGLPELTGLFRRDPALVVGNAQPSLEVFAARFEHADAFSEQELLELYQEEYASSKSEARKARLQSRMRQALDLLERAIHRLPQASDPIAQWLAPQLAGHLQAAGLLTLGQVRAALDLRKSPRWEEVPGIGERWANRLVRWMDEHVIVVAPVQLPAAFVPPDIRPSEHGIVPLSRAQAPAALNNPLQAVHAAPQPLAAWVPYPAPRNRLGAQDDRHAIDLWLQASAGDNANTRRAYSRIAERLYLWCQLERRCGFADLKVEDCIHYRSWLSDMGRKTPEEWAQAGWHIPAAQWMGNRVARRDSPAWRPFEKPLAKSSVAQELTVVRSFFSFLDKGRVVDGNPWELMGGKHFTTPFSSHVRQYVGRSLTMAQWRYLVDGLEPGVSEFESRLLLILWLGFGCGMRSAEIVALTFANLRLTQDSWHLDFMGKGGKWRTVTLTQPARKALIGYLACIGIPLQAVVDAASGLHPQTTAQPILRGQKGRRKEGRTAPSFALSYSTLFRVLKSHFEARALTLESSEPVAAQQLRRASGHWLRHSFATNALQSGMPIDVVQKALGHASVSTTGRYLTTEARRMDEEMEKFSSTMG